MISKEGEKVVYKEIFHVNGTFYCRENGSFQTYNRWNLSRLLATYEYPLQGEMKCVFYLREDDYIMTNGGKYYRSSIKLASIRKGLVDPEMIHIAETKTWVDYILH